MSYRFAITAMNHQLKNMLEACLKEPPAPEANIGLLKHQLEGKE